MTNFITNFRPIFNSLTRACVIICLLLCTNAAKGDNIAQGVKVIVIDAGHGGDKFPGASYGKIYEKDINLQVALKLGALLNQKMPEVKVVYTRTTDKLFSTVLADDLQARADIAHRNNGDLFISIHSNAHRNTAVQGVETLIMGESDREQRANQNALYLNNKDELLDMSDQRTATIVRAYIQNLQFTYGEYSEMMARLIQEQYAKLGLTNRGVRRQPLKVLYATDMPSVLTEIGFMSNPTDLKYITSEKGQRDIVNAIYLAIKQYCTNVNRALLLESPAPQAEVKPAPQTAPQQPATPTTPATATKGKGREYAIQLMASAKSIPTSHPEFKSYKERVWEYVGSGTLKYKYCVGRYSTKEQAQKAIKGVRKEFPQAFIITISKQ